MRKSLIFLAQQHTRKAGKAGGCTVEAVAGAVRGADGHGWRGPRLALGGPGSNVFTLHMFRDPMYAPAQRPKQP